MLDDHLNRQSYQLTLDCPQCLKKCVFTNKCKMYEHLHGEHNVDKARCAEIASMFVSLQVLPRVVVKTAETSSASPTDFGGEGDMASEDKMEDSDTDELPPLTIAEGATGDSGQPGNGSGDAGSTQESTSHVKEEPEGDKDSDQVKTTYIVFVGRGPWSWFIVNWIWYCNLFSNLIQFI